MREMKDSGIEWIGEIPADWKLSKIGAVYEERNEKVSDADFPPLSVTKQGVVPQLETAAKTNDGDNRKLIRKNDFVINSRSDRRGSCGISEYDGSCSLINTVLKPRRNMCNAYYSFVFRSERFADEFYRWGNGIVDDLWSTKWSNMKRIYIPAPSLQEQRRIADYLDRKCSQIDAIIARQQEVIEKLKAYKLSVITEAVTSTDSQMCRFRNCITTIEQGWSPAPAEIVGEDGWFVLSLSAVKNGKFIKLSKKPIDANENIPTQLSIKVGDLLMTRSNTRELVGDVCLVDSDCPKTIFSDLIYRISLNDALLPCYAIFLLQSAFIRQQIQESARGSSGSMPKISHKSIKNLNIHLPSIPEQREISDFLRNKCNYIDTCIQEKERLIKKLTSYKKSLIYEVVTGKKEV